MDIYDVQNSTDATTKASVKILVLLLFVLLPVMMYSQDIQRASTLSNQQLVEALKQERDVGFISKLQGNADESFDSGVEEVFRRNDPSIIPMLIELLNDETIVFTPAISPRYDVSIRLKDKVRFILSRWLAPKDWAVISRLQLNGNYDIKRVKKYYHSHSVDIVRGLRLVLSGQG